MDETRERGTEDARRVAGRAATTGRVDGEISWKSSNARRIAGMSQCVGYGVILRRTRRKMPPIRRGVTVRRKRVEEDGRGPEGSDFAAEEGGPDAEEGYEDVWDEVQEPLSRWSMKSLTRLPRPSKVSSVATLFGIIPSVSAVLGYV